VARPLRDLAGGLDQLHGVLERLLKVVNGARRTRRAGRTSGAGRTRRPGRTARDGRQHRARVSRRGQRPRPARTNDGVGTQRNAAARNDGEEEADVLLRSSADVRVVQLRREVAALTRREVPVLEHVAEDAAHLALTDAAVVLLEVLVERGQPRAVGKPQNLRQVRLGRQPARRVRLVGVVAHELVEGGLRSRIEVVVVLRGLGELAECGELGGLNSTGLRARNQRVRFGRGDLPVAPRLGDLVAELHSLNDVVDVGEDAHRGPRGWR